MGVVLGINDHGGRVNVYGNDGKSYASPNINDDGGVVNTIDKMGNAQYR